MRAKTLWHVSTRKGFLRYLHSGCILPPVKAWITPEAAIRFSYSTGRRIILRLRANSSFKPLDGHQGLGVVSTIPYTDLEL